MKTLKVLIAEDAPTNLTSYKDRYSEFFLKCGYNSDIQDTPCNPQRIMQLLGTGDFHVLITDITFGQEMELKGLALIADVKQKWPLIFVIGNSMANFEVTRTLGATFDMFVPKPALISKDIIKLPMYRERFQSRFELNTEIEIGPNDLDSYSGSSKVEVRQLVQTCLFSGHMFDETFDVSRVNLKPLTRGYSDSRVFRVQSFARSGGFKHIQSVIKISEVSKARLELTNFNRYVRWTLPFEWRVDVLGSAFGSKYGAICYSFVDGNDSDDKIFDLEHYIVHGNHAKISYVIGKIMNVDARKWYQIGIYSAHPSITEYYSDTYFTKYDSTFGKTQLSLINSLSGVLDCVQSGDYVVINSLGLKIPLPTRDVLARADFPCQTCIGHGDLHSRNILVSDKDEGKVVFIDFQQTGRCHVFEDFVVLETSIRLHYPSNLPQAELFEAEGKINSAEFDNLDEKHDLIAKLRASAVSHFPDEPYRNYIFAVLVFSFRLLREKTIDDEGRKRLVLCVLAACRYFQTND